jgi:hypothetical protein
MSAASSRSLPAVGGKRPQAAQAAQAAGRKRQAGAHHRWVLHKPQRVRNLAGVVRDEYRPELPPLISTLILGPVR